MCLICTTNFLETYERQFKNAIRRYLPAEQFDLILYSTPPITLTGVVNFIKNKNPQAVSYLLLKEIFPKNAVDLGMFGLDGILDLKRLSCISSRTTLDACRQPKWPMCLSIMLT